MQICGHTAIFVSTQTKQCARTNIGIFKSVGSSDLIIIVCVCFACYMKLNVGFGGWGWRRGKTRHFGSSRMAILSFLAEDELTSLNILYTFHLKLLVISVLP